MPPPRLPSTGTPRDQSVTQLRHPYPTPLSMPHLIDPHRIRAALDRAGLSYVEQGNPNLPEQAAVWLTTMLAAPRNLTAVHDPQAAIRKHLIEPLAGRHRLLAADLPLPHGPLIDIGSGNGAPGLPVALCEPGREAVLLDARSAAVSFLNEVIAQIGAPRIGVLKERAELAARTIQRERFALAVTRAAAPPAAALELTIPYLQIGGVAAAWTAELSADETERLAEVATALGAELSPIDPPHDMLVATKLYPTNPRYPRPWPQIRRSPPTL